LVGWQLPQLLTARRTARLSRYKPLAIWVTFHERLPFLGLALVALFVPSIPKEAALALTFLMFGWHAIGIGLTSPPYQSMIAKIMPARRLGTFFGAQSSVFSLLSAVGAALAGVVLTAVAYPVNFGICFFLAAVMMGLSWLFLASTREPDSPPPEAPTTPPLWRELLAILRRDAAFRRFIVMRITAQFALVAISFYTIYGVRRFDLAPDVLGLMTSVLLIAQTIANPLCGWLGDRFGHHFLFAGGALALGGGSLLALAAPEPSWLYAAFALAGIGNAIQSTSSLTLGLSFGQAHERPYYVSLSNTLAAPFALIAPLLSGWLADTAGYGAMFGLTVAAALITAAVTFRRAPTTVRTPLPADP
jgi:MFS family permease